MEGIDRIRQQERVVQLVAGALLTGVVILGGVAYFLVRTGTWVPMDRAVGVVILYAGMGVMVVGLLMAPRSVHGFEVPSVASTKMRSSSDTPPRSSCPKPFVRGWASWV